MSGNLILGQQLMISNLALQMQMYHFVFFYPAATLSRYI